MKQFFENNFPKIKQHFDLVCGGKEDLVIVLWVWGGVAYLSSFFINKLVLLVNIMFLKWLISILTIAYFIWHIFVVRKCSPKKPPLSPEEKALLKQDRFKRFLRKLFLKEPFTKWDPAIISIAIDLYVITHFLEYLVQ